MVNCRILKNVLSFQETAQRYCDKTFSGMHKYNKDKFVEVRMAISMANQWFTQHGRKILVETIYIRDAYFLV